MDQRKLIVTEGFTWKCPFRRIESRCDLHIYKRNQGAVVIVSERINDHDSGISVTNGIQNIATEVLKTFELAPNYVIFVEHYPWIENEHRREATFDLVQLNYIAVRNCFEKPRWVRINRNAVDALIAT